MARTFVSFLGIANYFECNYSIGDDYISENEVKYVQEAIISYINIEKPLTKEDKVIVLLTNKAKELNWGNDGHKERESNKIIKGKGLENRLRNLNMNCSVEALSIKDGKNESEIWEMFEAITNSIPEESELVIDITYGFRSQPLLALAVCVYLETLKNVDVKSIFYGAYDSRDTSTNTAPILNLIPFLELINWSFATRLFLKQGNASWLSFILDDIKDKFTPKRKPTEEELVLKNKINLIANLGDKLKKTTDSLAVNRIMQSVMESASLEKDFKNLSDELPSELLELKPFSFLLKKISSKFNVLSAASTDFFSHKGFLAQGYAINFYLENNQFVQAITLACEAYISKWCVIFDRNPISKTKVLKKDISDRHIISQWLGFLQSLLQNVDLKNELTTDEYNIADFWERITSVRNDVNHAGMRLNPLSADKIIEKVKSVCLEVTQFLEEPTEELTQKTKEFHLNLNNYLLYKLT